MGADIKKNIKPLKKERRRKGKKENEGLDIVCVWNQTGPSMNNLNFPAVQCSVSKGDLQS